ncbi:MAG: serine/threonine-protein kinase [Acidobacteriota bacterium]
MSIKKSTSSSIPPRGSDRAAPPVWQVGDLVADRFRVLDLLGSGGLGQVYAAQDLELNTQVALKTLRSDFIAGAGARSSLQREVQLVGQVRHPNLCQVYGLHWHCWGAARAVPATGSTVGWPVVAMEWLQGETLEQRLERGGALPPARARQVAMDIARALSVLHAAGIVHGDIAASNILLARDEGGAQRAVVMDFGLARAVGRDDDDLANLPPGTVAYMAPERIQGGPSSPASDLYAAGLVIYQALTGVIPFLKVELAATLRARLTEEPLPPRLLCRNLEADFEALLLRCLKRDPSARFASAWGFLGALAGATVGEAAADELRAPEHGSRASEEVRGASLRTRAPWER